MPLSDIAFRELKSFVWKQHPVSEKDFHVRMHNELIPLNLVARPDNF